MQDHGNIVEHCVSIYYIHVRDFEKGLKVVMTHKKSYSAFDD